MIQLWKKILFTGFAQAYSLAVSILVLSLTSKYLGPEGRGEIAAVNTWVQLFATFGSLSLAQVALHRMSELKDAKHFGRLLATLMALTATLSFLGWEIAWGLYIIPNGEPIFRHVSLTSLFIAFIGLPFILWEQYGGALLMGMDKLYITNTFQIIGRTTIALSLPLFVVYFGWGVPGALTSFLLGQIIVASGGLSQLIRQAKISESRFGPDLREALLLVKRGLKLHPNAIGTFLFASLNILILNHYRGNTETGYFQLAVQLLGIMTLIPQAGNMVIFGRITQFGPNAAWPEHCKLLLQVMVFMILASGLAAWFSPWIIPLVAGEKFYPAIGIFRSILWSIPGLTLSIMMAPQWIGRGLFFQAAGLTLAVGAVNLALNLFYIPKIGITGAIYAYIGTYIFSIFGNGGMILYCHSKYKSYLESNASASLTHSTSA